MPSYLSIQSFEGVLLGILWSNLTSDRLLRSCAPIIYIAVLLRSINTPLLL